MAVREIDEELSGQVGIQRRIAPTHGYYRLPNGWIKVAVITRLERVKYEEEGWKHLPEYGAFDMTSAYVANHPLELLFMKGGAKELPVQQVLQMGLHLNTEPLPVCGHALTQFHRRHTRRCFIGAAPVDFPQLEGLQDIGPVPCRYCGDAKVSIQVRDQHERVMHKDEMGNMRMGQHLAESLAGALSTALGKPSGQVVVDGDAVQEAIRIIQAGQPSQPLSGQKYQCGLCGEGFGGIQKLGTHMREVHGGGEED